MRCWVSSPFGAWMSLNNLPLENSKTKYPRSSAGILSALFLCKSKNPGIIEIPGFFMAAGEGFEPSQTESESVVLPLHNPAISYLLLRHSQAQGLLYQNLMICQACFQIFFIFSSQNPAPLFLCFSLSLRANLCLFLPLKSRPEGGHTPHLRTALSDVWGSVLLGTAALVLSLVLLLVLGILAVGLVLGTHVGFVLLLVLHKAHLAFTGPIIPPATRGLYKKFCLVQKFFQIVIPHLSRPCYTLF